MKGRPIPGLKEYQGRNPNGYFNDLPWEVQRRARYWLLRFRQKWGSNLPRRRFAILVGQARRLALNPPTSAWGRSMAAKKGGYAAQQKYRMEGRHPTEYATRVRVLNQRAKKRADAEAAETRITSAAPLSVSAA